MFKGSLGFLTLLLQLRFLLQLSLNVVGNRVRILIEVEILRVFDVIFNHASKFELGSSIAKAVVVGENASEDWPDHYLVFLSGLAFYHDGLLLDFASAQHYLRV